MSDLAFGARFARFPKVVVPSARAKQAAKDTMMTVLFGIDFSRPSPWTAARMTFMAEASPAARKNCFTSFDAVGWLTTLQ